MRTLLCLPLLLAAPLAVADDAAQRFHALTEREWAWRLEQSPGLASAVGVHDYDDRLGDVSERAHQARRKHEEATLAELGAIDATALPREQRIDYTIFRDQLRDAIDDVALGDYLMPVNSDSSFHAEIAQLPREMPFATEHDYEYYLARLAAVPKYFDDNVALMRAGLARGVT